MVDVLRKYLAIRKQISMKGIGTVSVEQLPARVDFPNQLLHPPETILHYSPSAQHDDDFCKWLSKELQISETQAVDRYHSFTAEMVKELGDSKKISWAGVGEFVKKENGIINFKPAIETSVLTRSVAAKKIIRQGARHSIRVGEDEKTNAEMQEMLLGDEQKVKKGWWLAAILLLLTALIVIVIYFSSKKRPSMHGNQNKPTISESPTLYKIQ
jgi:nucleoid DNA-binding protein